MDDVPVPAEPARPSTRFAPSKFVTPAASRRHVRRTALRRRLDGAGDRLRAVIGPPGAGKTSLLAEWSRLGTDGPMCWLHADDGDADPLRFWHAFIAALRTTVPAFAEECLEMFRHGAPVDNEWLEQLLSAIDALDGPVTIVIDDFHRVGAIVQRQVGFLLERGVQPLQLAIGTRVEPDIGLHRLRLDHQVCELREADLQFGRTDARDLFSRFDAPLGDDALDAVMARTEGWVAGLQLAALAMRDAAEPSEVVRRLNGTNQVIAHYLWSEVFTAQHADVQRFLLDTCVVDELQPALAAALSPSNRVTLLDIERAGLMLRRIDGDDEDTFRFHHLLTDMLRVRLRADDPAHEAVLHERAAAWYAEHGRPVDAFRHRWRAGRRAEALQTMHGTVLDVVYDPIPAMSQAERALGDDDVIAAPGPAVSFAAALIVNGFVAEAQRLARRVQSLASDSLGPEELDQLRTVLILTAFTLGDFDAAVQLGADLPWRVPPASPWTIIARCGVARAHVWQHDFDAADDRLDGLLPDDATMLHRMEAASTVAQLQLFRGDLTAGTATLHELFADLDHEGRVEVRDGWLAQAILGNLALERGDTVAAERMLREVSETRSDFRVPAFVLASIGLSRVSAVGGRFAEAMAAVDDTYRKVKARPARSGILDLVRRQHARLLLLSGAIDEATAVAEQITADLASRALLLAEVAIARGDPGDAERHLDGLASTAAATTRWRLDSNLARLTIDISLGRPSDARTSEILDLVVAEQFVFPLAEAAPATLTPIQRAARRRPRSAVTDAIARLLPRVQVPAPPPAGGAEALTDRERAVLRYMATSLTYSEIAGELYVSRNTLKTHVKNISQKLNASSRSEVLDRARELRYL